MARIYTSKNPQSPDGPRAVNKTAIASTLLAFSIFGNYAQYKHNSYLKTQEITMQSQINDLRAQSRAETERYKQAYKKSLEEMKDSQKTTDTILMADVPKDCDKAVAWGLEKARDFRL